MIEFALSCSASTPARDIASRIVRRRKVHLAETVRYRIQKNILYIENDILLPKRKEADFSYRFLKKNFFLFMSSVICNCRTMSLLLVAPVTRNYNQSDVVHEYGVRMSQCHVM